jgi:hypothetical protein
VLALVASTRGDAPIAARVLGRAPTTDPLLQGESYLLLLEDDPPPPGTALVATMAAGDRARAGVTLPPEAIVWYDGAPFAFVAVRANVFERRALTLYAKRGDRWLVTVGVIPGERLVTGGAQQLLSAQLLTGRPED